MGGKGTELSQATLGKRQDLFQIGELRALLGEVLQQAPSVLRSCSIPVEGWEVFTARPQLKFKVGRLGQNCPHTFFATFPGSKLTVLDPDRRRSEALSQVIGLGLGQEQMSSKGGWDSRCPCRKGAGRAC